MNTSARLGFVIEDAKQSDSTTLYIFDVIGDPYEGKTSGQFSKELSAVRTPVINLIVDSPGGTVDDMLAMYHSLKAHPAYVNSYVIGGAHSSASVLVQAADKRHIAPHASMTIHEAHALPLGTTAADLRAAADYLESASNTIATIYSERSGKPAEEWRAMMLANGGTIGTTFIGKDAVSNGLADAVALPATNYTPLELVAQRLIPGRVAAQVETTAEATKPVDFKEALEAARLARTSATLQQLLEDQKPLTAALKGVL